MKVLLLLTLESLLALLILLEVSESQEDHVLHRSKRIAIRRRHHKNRTKIQPDTSYDTDPWGNPLPPRSTSKPSGELETDEFQDYPDGYFVKPGVTDAPEHYDYASDKFNRSYLTNPEWRDDAYNHSRKYNVRQSYSEMDFPQEVQGVQVPQEVENVQKPAIPKVPAEADGEFHRIVDKAEPNKSVLPPPFQQIVKLDSLL